MLQLGLIQKALNHCKRAKFDTYEASTTLILERIKKFHNRYSHIKETQDVLSDYVDNLENVQRISDELQEIVSSKYETREEDYEKIGINHDALKILSQKFELAKPQIEVLVEDNNTKKKSEKRHFVVTFIFSTLALVVSIIGLILLSVKVGVLDFKDKKASVIIEGTTQNNNQSIEIIQ